MLSVADKILLMAPPMLVAVILHEIAHGVAAEKLGDPTARKLGRITLNPFKHIDLFMTILLPGALILSGSPVIFGGAKPVPINPTYFKNPRKGMVIVAIAGPLINIILAAAAFAVLKAPGFAEGIGYLGVTVGSVLLFWLVNSVMINLVLALFNLTPVPPLDGGRVAVGLLPISLARPLARLEPYGILIVFLLLYSGLLDKVLTPILELVFNQLIPPGIQ